MVVGIVAFIATIVLVNHARFTGNLVVTNMAYEIALSIRQAQAFGLGVQQQDAGASFDVFNDSAFDTSYGIRFSSSTRSYMLFADNNKNEHFDPPFDEEVDRYTLRQGYTISDFCVPASGPGNQCRESNNLRALSITFQRPQPDAKIRYRNAGNTVKPPTSGSPEDSARIIIESPQGEQRSVTVYWTGQIAVENR